ncbi:helix-turn-helix domain-containing protein [Candidatus Allofournierella excrementavium]|uniref:AraC family transcriptional regulator n=1 Tax=Candidatus Allofournierella excrementavium TaxID=2838591 RepID=UPI00374F63D8
MIQQEKRAFDAGAKVWVQRYENLRNLAHWHFEDELVVCQGGEVRLTLNGCVFELAEGDCAFISRESVHSIAGAPGSRAAVAQFVGLFDAPLRLRAPVFADRYQAGARLDELDRECREKRPFYAEKMNALITSLMADVFRGEPLAEQAEAAQPTLARYKQLLLLLEQQGGECTFEEAADFMHMSPAYFSRYFKKMTGLTFSSYLNVLRVDRAVELLAGGEDITMADLMARCGFNTLRNFNRVFKAVTGYAPTSLPAGFSLDRRVLLSQGSTFDPTLDTSVVL